jgi:hypothetical protein
MEGEMEPQVIAAMAMALKIMAHHLEKAGVMSVQAYAKDLEGIAAKTEDPAVAACLKATAHMVGTDLSHRPPSLRLVTDEDPPSRG